MELFPFKDNASDQDILKSLDKLWDCKYLTQIYIEITLFVPKGTQHDHTQQIKQ